MSISSTWMFNRHPWTVTGPTEIVGFDSGFNFLVVVLFCIFIKFWNFMPIILIPNLIFAKRTKRTSIKKKTYFTCWAKAELSRLPCLQITSKVISKLWKKGLNRLFKFSLYPYLVSGLRIKIKLLKSKSLTS